MLRLNRNAQPVSETPTAREYSPRMLAEALAVRTHHLEDQLLLELRNNDDRLTGLYQAFQKSLIAELTEEDFADMCAQTVTYGLFAATMRHDGEFTRKAAFDYIPAAAGVLHDLFRFISREELREPLSRIIDDVCAVLSAANVIKLFHHCLGSDPVAHFYETFLARYNPAEREQRGVYYTPEDAVGYIIRSLNIILKQYFEKVDGFASRNVIVFDPAAGTSTFLAEAVKTAINESSILHSKGHLKDHRESGPEHFARHELALGRTVCPCRAGQSALLRPLGEQRRLDKQGNP
ncbi:MAG: N-6 DNA methylase [Sedimentisphaerales bacterium]